MQAGVSVTDDCVTIFNELKLKHSHRYVIFRLSADLTQVEIESQGAAADKDWKEFQGKLPENDCRYAVYDFEYDTPDGVRNKIVFIFWSPETAKIKSKMVYASTKDELKRRFVGLGSDVQANDASEVTYEAVLERVQAV
eukprot:CAMPEP_0117049412 /NCGR_PEP_ID=MMETSP0472-20121206/34120_1 /TAXON_ID=693140 ORGANISM="Tiarina fusus, Strain LIS" /NCGR_SAMPLE_ID=MMETSP0472 /ASSEMBLY_ACC=CAM_ASM_000603 /LENGTH=138 /DNA_ID=CAMNT_0004762811 /DNA_START=57 /DNA_END=473 /DNA_ORIENTATION=+